MSGTIEPTPVDAAADADPADTPAAPDLSPAACAARLAELFPALFGGPPKPIKLRIQVDIQQRAPGIFTKRVLSVFLSRYTTSNAYIKALLLAAHRFDLDGQPAGEISDLHRQAATEELARRREIHETRRAAERDAQREAQRAAQHHERETRRTAQRALAAEDGARRERAALLRAFESSPLKKANFCALKGIAEAELDALLAQARADNVPPKR